VVPNTTEVQREAARGLPLNADEAVGETSLFVPKDPICGQGSMEIRAQYSTSVT
jgi:hypothetical protein